MRQPTIPAAGPRLAVPGRNCWRLGSAARAAFLVDADAYFKAFAGALRRAREQVLILGWDVHAGTELHADGMVGGPADLRGLVNAVVRHRPGLRVYILDWDYSLVFAFERDLLPLVQLGWRTHRRVRFELDAQHPLGACHHQKIVVVDDAVAFAGGLDLTIRRWDTPAHAPSDAARVDPAGAPYDPFHDVQIMVDGAAAAVLGDLARERWRRATGRRLRRPRDRRDPWPGDVRPDLRHVEVAVARTEPAFDGRREVREVETLYLDAIASAKRDIYLENQYCTSDRICQALAARLAEPVGPEVVLVVPRTCAGWLEERTMGALRQRFVGCLREADRHGRLAIYHPRLDAGDTVRLNVHSKVMVVDDALVRIGSANLSNRSLGLDTECDLAIEAAGREDVAAGIASFRDRLLAEHLGVTRAAVAARIAATGSLLAAVAALHGGPRTLQPLPDVPDSALADAAAVAAAGVDLERPVEHSPILAATLPRHVREPAVYTVVSALALLAVALATAFVSSWAGIASWVEVATTWGEAVRTAPAGGVAVVAGFVAGSVLLLPVTVLVVLCFAIFDPVRACVLAFGGSLAAAAVTHAIGRLLRGGMLRRISGRHLDGVARRLSGATVTSVVLVRLLPVAPFSVVNMVAGAMGVPATTFLAGTALGMAPGILTLTALARLLGRAS